MTAVLRVPPADNPLYRTRRDEMRALRVEHDTVAALPAPDPAPLIEAPEHPLVLVVWRDAFFDFDRKPDEEPRADYLVHTVGFLLSDGPVFVSLAQEVLPNDDGYRAVTHIPLAIVERITELAPAADDADEEDAGGPAA
jgi:hypothetical protein